MPHTSSQTFLRELDKKLWTAADKLRSNLDAAVYKHAVLGLIFLKYVSDSFAQRQAEIEAMLKDPENDFFVDPAGYDQPAHYDEAIHRELEERDYYIEKNVFWVPALARWKTLQDSAKLPAGTEIVVKNGKTTTYKITSTGKLIDDALEAVEKENPKLKNVLNKNYTQLQIDPSNLAGLIDLIGSIDFEARQGGNCPSPQPSPMGRGSKKGAAHELPLPEGEGRGEGKYPGLHARDILGHVYEYFLGQFALAEGKKGGQYFTPKSIVSLIVEMIEPYQGRVYDPAMGSGGFFVQSERFIEEHGGTIGDIMVFGQESNPTTWRLAAMNMAIRGIDFDFGKEPADTFTRDQHPDLRADFVMANPPFNIKEWWDGKLEGDARWKYGTPPQGNANFAWVQHMLHHLAPNGSMALLLANGSMSSNSSGEGDIRRALIEADLVVCMVALPGQLFTNTQIPACIWFLTKNKAKRSRPGAAALRDRRGETLFIDARKLGFMKDRVLRDFSKNDIEKIADALRDWRTDREAKFQEGRKVGRIHEMREYGNVPGFCKAASLQEIAEYGYSLTPGRFVGAADIEGHGEPFDQKMARLIADLDEQFEESARLESAIKANLGSLSYAG